LSSAMVEHSLPAELARDVPADCSRLRSGLLDSHASIVDLLSQKSVRHGKPRALHALRKRIKQLDYQLQLVGSDTNRGVTKRHAFLKQLGTGLGDIHDWQQLRKSLRQLPDSALHGDLITLIEQENRLHISSMLDLANAVFAVDSAVFCASTRP
jgi:CHAD domain-containing protein